MIEQLQAAVRDLRGKVESLEDEAIRLQLQSTHYRGLWMAEIKADSRFHEVGRGGLDRMSLSKKIFIILILVLITHILVAYFV